MDEMVIGKYIRLSQEDRDLDDEKAVSNSILHQRDLIANYIHNNPELSSCRAYEFFDDGYSGTNFERPAFEKLIEKIKVGEINCVIVKDFSRFGRDYIELGDYLERIFPFLGVRFISINDGYDSNDYKGTTGGLDVVMKNIVYAYYSKDLSVKVKTAKMQKMKRGEFQGGRVPYGLIKDPNVKGKLIVDPEAAKVVKEIFGYAIHGRRLVDIAETLNKKGYETPSAYYRRKHPESKLYANTSPLSGWTIITVEKIIEQEMYYGAIVQHKREGLGVGRKHTRKVPKEEQIIIENMHEPIVSKEDFVRAQQIIKKRVNKKPGQKRDYPLKGYVKCAVCGRRLRYRKDTIKGKDYKYFQCPLARYQDGTNCSNKMIREEDLNQVVLQNILTMGSFAEKTEKKIAKRKASAVEVHLIMARDLGNLQRELEKCRTDKFTNVDSFMAGKIDKETYQTRRKEYTEQEAELQERIKILESDLQEQRLEDSGDTAKVVEKLKNYSQTEELTEPMVRALIKEVKVTDPEHIEIIWNFDDEVYKFITEE